MLSFQQAGQSKSLVVCSLLLFLSFSIVPQQCMAFGRKGHEGMFQNALKLLEATDSRLNATQWPDREWLVRSANYPDEAVFYLLASEEDLSKARDVFIKAFRQTLAGWTAIPLPVDKLSDAILPKVESYYDLLHIDDLDSLNSSEHYFDPLAPTRVFQYPTGEVRQTAAERLAYYIARESIMPVFWPAFEEQMTSDLRVKLLWIALREEDRQAVRDKVGEAMVAAVHLVMLRGIDRMPVQPGKTRTLDQCVDGGYSGDIEGADGVGYNAISAILFCLNGRHPNDDRKLNPSSLVPSAGFVELAAQAAPGKEELFVEALIGLGAAVHYVGDIFSPGHTDWRSWYETQHREFDELGDDYFSNLPLGSLDASPRVILSFDGTRKPCDIKGSQPLGSDVLPYPNGFWDSDLPATMFSAAEKSRALWEKHVKQEDDFPGDEHFQHIVVDSTEVVAGVIDWAFSRAAMQDGPYARDATNFFGMAAALLLVRDPAAVLAPDEFTDKAYSLGGVDQDDYFPVSGNTYRFVRVEIEGRHANAHMQVFMLTDGPQHTERISARRLRGNSSKVDGQATTVLEIDLLEYVEAAPRDFLLRVVSADRASLDYKVQFTDEPISLELADDHLFPVYRGRSIAAHTNRGTKCGYIDRTGLFIIEPKFDDVAVFSEGRAAVMFGRPGLGDWGYVDEKGELVVEAKFKSAEPFSEGRAAVSAKVLGDGSFTTRGGGTKYGFIDLDGNIAVPLKFSDAQSFSEDLAAVEIPYQPSRMFVSADRKRWGYVDRDGNYAIEPRFTTASPFKDGRAVVIYESSFGRRKTVYINKQGKIGKTITGRVLHYSEDLALDYVHPKAVIVNGQAGHTPGSYVFKNKSGKVVIQGLYSQAKPFSEGLAAVQKFGAQNYGMLDTQRWGFVDRNGDLVIPARYTNVHSFDHGLAWVTDNDGRSYYIDSDGKEVVYRHKTPE